MSRRKDSLPRPVSFTCNQLGFHPTTVPYMRSYVRITASGEEGRIYAVRVGFNVLDSEGQGKVFEDPFDPRFTAAYMEGKGGNPQAAIRSLRAKVESFCDALWWSPAVEQDNAGSKNRGEVPSGKAKEGTEKTPKA